MSCPLVPVVAVPARNEERLLPRLIRALERQTIVARLDRPLSVIIVINNTTDASRLTTHDAASRAPGLAVKLVSVEFPPERAHVGSARRLAMQIAAGDARSGVILTTDADAVPADDWVENNLRAIEAGADIVGGRIVGDPLEEKRLGAGFLRRAGLYARYGFLRDELAWLIDPVDHDPWPRHHDHTGASIAVRSDVYRAVGGMDPLDFREDLAFVSKVRGAGFRLRHPLDVSVTVSARICGRAPGGMADCLRRWVQEDADGIPPLFESPRLVEARLRCRRAIRQLSGMALPLAFRRLRNWGLIGAVADQEVMPHSISAMIERLAADDPDATGTMPAATAIALLEGRIGALRGLSDAA